MCVWEGGGRCFLGFFLKKNCFFYIFKSNKDKMNMTNYIILFLESL